MSLPEPSRRDTRLDPYVDAYAERTHGLQVSAVRALFAVANRPEVVSLAGGMPNIADLPREALGRAVDRLITERGTQAMQYGSGQGEPFMREKIVEVMAEEQIQAHADDIVVTCGSQQALDLITRVFCDPGDVVLAEAPSYVGALGTFHAYQCQVVHVAMDEHGLDPVALRAALVNLRAAGKRVKFLYTIPNFQNPSGVTQPVERRREIIEVAKEHDLLILEDNPYGLLTLEAEPLPALRSMDADNVVYLGSFSKIFAPGFRVGWALAPHAVREKLVLTQEAATLCPPVFSQFAIATYLDEFDWRSQITVYRDMYRERRDAMMAGLADHMVEGALIAIAAEVDDSMLARWNQRLPVVVLGRSTGNATDAVRLDDHGGMRVLVEHLIELGHRDIWLIEATGQRSGAERVNGYRETMAAQGLADHARLLPGNFTNRGGVQVAQRLLKDLDHLPTAIIGSNDLATVGLLETLRTAGIRVPEDISVAGFDNSRIASSSSINLTTVSQDIRGMAKLAMAVAIEALSTGNRETEEHVFWPRLILRATTAPPRTGPVAIRQSGIAMAVDASV